METGNKKSRTDKEEFGLELLAEFASSEKLASEFDFKPKGAVKYSGDMLNGNPHGNGNMTLPDGRIYQGEFFNGKPHGKVERADIRNATYSGELFAGKLHGIGKIIKKNGEEYEGRFFDGSYHGHGKVTKENKSYVGEFFRGRPHGMGEMTVGDIKSVGEFFAGKPIGKHKITYNCGCMYQADCKSDKTSIHRLADDGLTFAPPDSIHTKMNQHHAATCPKK